MFVIHDTTKRHIHSPRAHAKGYVPRDYSIYPIEMLSAPSEIPLIPRSDWDAIIDEQEEQQSTIAHKWKRKKLKHLDQNGQGYCWAYSLTHTVMGARVRDNQEDVRLSAHAVACKIKNFKDEGGWCGLSAEFIRKNGIPSVATWKEKSMSRQYDTAATWEDAKKYQVTEDYVDLTIPVWGRNLTFDQVATCLLMNIPVALDFDWWGHSVGAFRLVRIERGSWGPEIINSWPGWGENGFGVLQGNRAIPQGAVATRQVITT